MEDKDKKICIIIATIVIIFIITIFTIEYSQEKNSLIKSQTFNFKSTQKNENSTLKKPKAEKITDLSNEEINKIKDEIVKRFSLFYNSCDEDIEGECIDKSTDKYYIKTKIKDGEPSKIEKTIVEYRTLCRDGEYSPSNAKGRGACSHHGGVEDWNAPVYDTKYIKATPAQYKKEEIKFEDTQAYKAKYNTVTDNEVIFFYNLEK